MPTPSSHAVRRTHVRVASATALGALFLAGPLAASAQATVQTPPLASARNFSVLAGSEVTNIGPSTIGQDLGVSPGTSLPGPTGANALLVGGSTHSADAVAAQAQLDLTEAYNNAANQTVPNAQDTELGGETLKGGIYKVPTTADMGLNGTLTLDGENKTGTTASIWVFQAGRALTVGSGANVVLTRGANPCNVYWQVSTSATLGTASKMIGTVMADQSIAMQTGATLQGRVLARIAAVTLDHNVITSPLCRPVGLPGGSGGNGGTGGTGGTTGGTTGGDQRRHRRDRRVRWVRHDDHHHH